MGGEGWLLGRLSARLTKPSKKNQIVNAFDGEGVCYVVTMFLAVSRLAAEKNDVPAYFNPCCVL